MAKGILRFRELAFGLPPGLEKPYDRLAHRRDLGGSRALRQRDRHAPALGAAKPGDTGAELVACLLARSVAGPQLL